MSPMLLSWVMLAIAILSEVAGSTCLMLSRQFTRPLPSIGAAVLYVVAFYFLSLSLRHISLGIAYGVWAGCGVVLTAVIGLVVFRQALDAAALIGLGLIIAGVLVINLFSRVGH
ncbi:DMT family transporter [Falsirhodobacter algicola]|uniref:QacE family quaternary ammonium compound efflux SMR transporter n=1 Tax=Falsirhodobacter algicola TaxID=2692330 RepID=A0A8J8MVU3_9RHOB|nr:multidrug efflux SMR transporter [Falsirhodobacter algicola]QUS37326.1 QacE family quaternary ammonium compound efflux SMR transporter [Falsirhodobacter algicola]